VSAIACMAAACAALAPSVQRAPAPGQASGAGDGLAFDALLFDPARRELVLVNGYRPPATPASVPLWRWRDGRWNEVPAASAPPMRTVTGVTYDSRRGRIVLFGGLGPTGLDDPRSDLWEWDGERWWRGADTSAGARDHHSLVYDAGRGRTVLHGGIATGPQGERIPRTDTWEWDGTRWTKVAETGPQHGGGLVYDAARRRVVLFGGVGADAQRSGDTWTWDGADWEKVAESGPSPRNAQAMTFDPAHEVVLLFGGTNGERHFDDLWAWDGESWAEIEVAGERPGRRTGAGLAYDTARSRAVLYGGHVRRNDRVEESDDAWECDGSAWTRVR